MVYSCGQAYDSFGELTNSTGSLVNQFRYTARESDTETGLYYHRARYYDPSAGRFLSEDPIGLNGGLNFYPYVANSPENYMDSLGETIGVRGDYTSWQTALLYLCSSPAACKIIQDLEDSPELYMVNFSDSCSRDKAVDGKTVFWNPHRGLCVKGGVESPAISLLQELGHVWQSRHHKTGNLEEAAVQITNPAAIQLGEPTRINYSDARGHSTFALPIPSSATEKCQCQEQKK